MAIRKPIVLVGGKRKNLPSGDTIPTDAVPVMIGSGSSHASGLVPDPPASAGAVLFLREDGTWAEAGGGGGGWTTIVKGTDESVTSSTAVQDDDALQFAVDANGKYAVRIRLHWHDSNSYGGIRVAFSVPSGATMLWNVAQDTDAFSGFAAKGASYIMEPLTESGEQTTQTGTAARFLDIIARVTVGGTGGTCKLRWAQDLSAPTATVVYAHSVLDFIKVN